MDENIKGNSDLVRKVTIGEEVKKELKNNVSEEVNKYPQIVSDIESDSFDTNNVPITLQPANYDMDIGIAMSKSLDSKEMNILDFKGVAKLYAHQLEILLKRY